MKTLVLPPIKHHNESVEGCLISLTQESFAPLSLSSKLYQIETLLNDNPPYALQLIEKLPKSDQVNPLVMNFKIYCYIQLRKIKKANQLIRENYLLNPDSPLAVMNYGDFLLRRKDIKTFELLLPSPISLSSLFPSKRTFYREEARAYYTMMGFYFLQKDERSLARLYYSQAYKLNPYHSSVILLEKKLTHIPFFKRLARLVVKLKLL